MLNNHQSHEKIYFPLILKCSFSKINLDLRIILYNFQFKT